ncbi:hypothetical protein [Erythrobacter aurantius]|uniref:hypothetical protein n=1 Tax=Erythrobacter aurantius TaxID=2909249 RepID=UPI00207A3322|nr:hypothetical protein [Erythrobacter aurantius]
MDGTPAYVSLYKVMPKAGQQLKKAAAEIKLKTYLLGMEKESRLLITGKREFIAPCLGTAYVSDGEEVERNVMISRIAYKVQKSGIVTQITPFMNIPHHAFGRIFERDLRPPDEVAKAIVNSQFIDTVLELHSIGDPEGSENAFALRFLGGFLTGTVREVIAGNEVVDTKILDVRTFLHADDKPEWVAMTTDKPYAFFQYVDRRSKNASIDEISDFLKGAVEPEALRFDPLLLMASVPRNKF